MDDDEEIYEAPSSEQMNFVMNVSQIRKAFENRNSIPIKVATDGRHQAADCELEKPNKAKPKQKPETASKPSNVFAPWKNKMPELPLKKSPGPLLPPKKSPLSPKPQLPDNTPAPKPEEDNVSNSQSQLPPKTSPISPVGSILRKSMDRNSIFPPAEEQTTDNKTESSNHKKKPLDLTPLNGIHPLMPHNGQTNDISEVLITSKGRFRKRPLPAMDKCAPKKPAKLPADISLAEFETNLQSSKPPAQTVELEEDDIYDDIAAPSGDDIIANKPVPPLPPQVPAATTNLRPVSMIPEMTEEDEIKEGDRKLNIATAVPQMITEEGGGQEIYDDIAAPETTNDQSEEIYEAVDGL